MTLELRVLTGSRAGQHERFTKSVVAIGRHPLCDFRFDPAQDLDVSTRHAEIRAVGGVYTLYDIGSTNGTFVNGLRVPGQQVLAPGDVVSFGEFGPRVEIALPADESAAIASAPAAAAVPAPPAAGAPVRPTRSATSDGIAAAAGTPVGGPARARRWLVPVGALVLVAAVAGAYWLGHRGATTRDAELQRLSRTNDSLAHTYAERTAGGVGQAQGLDSSLAAAQHQRDAVRTALSGTGDRSSARADSLARELHTLESRRRAMLDAAQVDYSTIAARSGPAVTMIAVQWPDSSAFSGSGFSISRSGEIVTNRHLVQRAGNQLPMRIAVIFADTRAWLPAHVVRVSASADLALLQVDAAGPFPTVAGIAPHAAATAVGKSVAIIGYPLGTDTPMEGSGTHITARSTLVAGTLSKNLADVLQIDAYAGEGSSGSPVFNTSGNVIGVVYGGARESAGRIVYAVPSDAIGALQAEAGARE